MKRFFPLLALLTCAAPAIAQEQVYRLSEADKQAAIDAAAQQPESNTRLRATTKAGKLPARRLPAGSLPIVDGRAPGSPDKRVRSEVGMMVGTGGTRALYGSTAVLLGESGMAQFSFSTGRYNNFGGFGGFGSGFGFNQYADGSIPFTQGGSPFAMGHNPYGLDGFGNPSPFGYRPY